jgi:uncharacterized membrane protein YdjX (TVP38/TMEM64 family)
MHLPGSASSAPTPPPPSKTTRRISQIGWIVILLVASIVGSLIADYVLGRWIELDPEQIRVWLDGLGWRAPVVFMMLMIAAVVISPIPSVPLDIAAGLAFGLFWGTVYTLIGAEIGAMIAFFIARRLGRPRVMRWIPPAAIATVDRIAEHRGFFTVFMMRLLPLFSFDWVSYGAGLSAIRFRVFMAATLLGMTPPVIAIVAVGATLPSSPWLAGTIFGALVLALVLPLASPRFRAWATAAPNAEGTSHHDDP